jgi:YbbR domain-containing protein
LINGDIEMKIKNEKLFIQIACLTCAVVLWVIVMVQTNPILDETIKNVPVTIKNLSALESSNMVLMNKDKDNLLVNIKVKGTGEQLSKINKTDFTAYIDVLGLGEGNRNVKVEVSGPNEIEIGDHYPSQIACVVESVISRVMDVDIQYEGSQLQDYFRASGTSNPSSVKITGPRSIVDSAKAAIATINVDGAKDTVIKTVPVRIYNGTDTEIFMSVPTDNVEVSVPIYPTKYVNIKPNISGEPLDGYELVNTSVSPTRVKIAARRDILDSINELEIEELDITDAYHNILSSRKILNDSGFMILGLDKDPVVNVVVEKIIQKELTYKIDEIEFTNIIDGYEVDLSNTDISVIANIEGASSAVNNFNKEELKLTVDLSQASLGSNNITIKSLTDNKQVNVLLNIDTIEVNIIEPENQSSTETNTINLDNQTEME